MCGRVLLLLAVLCTSGCSLPVTSGHLESEDVKVLKCIVEALADVLSKPHPLPVSQDCRLTLTTDERLVSILRHQNFLKELVEIATEGGQKRAQDDPELPQTQSEDDSPDRSMLEAAGGPGERSILSQLRRGSMGETAEEQRGEEEEEEGGGKTDQPGPQQSHWRSKEKKDSEHSEKRATIPLREKEEKQTMKEERRSGLKLWDKRDKSAQKKKKALEEKPEKRVGEEIPHHSKEVTKPEVSPEEAELQLIAYEDGGSGGSKRETEVESLETIESQLENVAQKLHQLRRAERGQQRA